MSKLEMPIEDFAIAVSKENARLNAEIERLRADNERLRAALLKPPRHKFWGAGEPDCPPEIRASNGELHSVQCKRCGLVNPKNDICLAALEAKDE